MGLATTRQRSFQRALSISRLQKRKCLDIKGEGLGLDLQEKLPSQGVLRPPEALQEANPWIWPNFRENDHLTEKWRFWLGFELLAQVWDGPALVQIFSRELPAARSMDLGHRT